PRFNLPPVSRIGQRAPGAALDDQGSGSLSGALRWQKAGHFRMAANPLPQCHLRAQKPILCRCLCLRQKRAALTALVDGRLRKTYGHGKPLEACEVLLKDHHEGYIDWAEFE